MLKARILDGVIGFILGFLIGIAIALIVSKSDRKLRRRDEIADAIGIPVLASIPVLRPSDAAGWTRLLDTYEPAVVDAWSLRKALRQLGLTDFSGAGQAGTSLTVISVAGDRPAWRSARRSPSSSRRWAFRPRSCSARSRIRTPTATLAAACGGTAATPSGRPVNMRLGTGVDRQSGAALTVVVATVDGKAPDLTGTMRTTATVLGVSAGGTTAEQLARVAVNAARDGREITGILVGRPRSDRPHHRERAPGRAPDAPPDAHPAAGRHGGDVTAPDTGPVGSPVWASHDLSERYRSVNPAAGLVSLSFVGAALRRRARVWVGAAIAGVILGAALFVLAPPPYQASTSLIMKAAPTENPADAMQTDVALVQTRAVAGRVVNQLKLTESVPQVPGQLHGRGNHRPDPDDHRQREDQRGGCAPGQRAGQRVSGSPGRCC